MKTFYAILSTIAFAGFCVAFLQTQIPHLPLLLFAMFFAVMARLEDLK